MEHFVSAKTLFVLKRYDIANASITPLHVTDSDSFYKNICFNFITTQSSICSKFENKLRTMLTST